MKTTTTNHKSNQAELRAAVTREVQMCEQRYRSELQYAIEMLQEALKRSYVDDISQNLGNRVVAMASAAAKYEANRAVLNAMA